MWLIPTLNQLGANRGWLYAPWFWLPLSASTRPTSQIWSHVELHVVHPCWFLSGVPHRLVNFFSLVSSCIPTDFYLVCPAGLSHRLVDFFSDVSSYIAVRKQNTTSANLALYSICTIHSVSKNLLSNACTGYWKLSRYLLSLYWRGTAF